MKVHELITALQAIEDKNLEVVMASDPEQNSYRLLTEVNSDLHRYIEEGETLEVRYAKLTKAMRKDGYTSDDIMKASEADGECIVLVP